MKDGRPNLSAPAPRATNGKPDLTGVWKHETFSLEQMKKFYGPAADEEGHEHAAECGQQCGRRRETGAAEQWLKPRAPGRRPAAKGGIGG